jgi:DNA repair exonuclease SbcCD ATPase subunit
MSDKSKQALSAEPLPTLAEYVRGFFWFLREDDDAASCPYCSDQLTLKQQERQARERAEQFMYAAQQRATQLDLKIARLNSEFVQNETSLRKVAQELSLANEALEKAKARLQQQEQEHVARVSHLEKELRQAQRQARPLTDPQLQRKLTTAEKRIAELTRENEQLGRQCAAGINRINEVMFELEQERANAKTGGSSIQPQTVFGAVRRACGSELHPDRMSITVARDKVRREEREEALKIVNAILQRMEKSVKEKGHLG